MTDVDQLAKLIEKKLLTGGPGSGIRGHRTGRPGGGGRDAFGGERDYWVGGMRGDKQFEKRMMFVKKLSDTQGDAVADQAAGLLGVAKHEDRFRQNQGWKPKEKMRDMNSNALRIIQRAAEKGGRPKLAARIGQYLATKPGGRL